MQRESQREEAGAEGGGLAFGEGHDQLVNTIGPNSLL